MLGVNYYPDWVQLYIIAHFIVFQCIVFSGKRWPMIQRWNLVFSAFPMYLLFILLVDTNAGREYLADVFTLIKINSLAYWERFVEHLLFLLFFISDLYLFRITFLKKISTKIYFITTTIAILVLLPLFLNVVASLSALTGAIGSFDGFWIALFFPHSISYLLSSLVYVGVDSKVIDSINFAMVLGYLLPNLLTLGILLVIGLLV